MAKHGTVAAIAMHRAAGSELCGDCEAFLRRLQSEAFHSVPSGHEEQVTLSITIPRTAYWRLMFAAEREDVSPEQLASTWVTERAAGPKPAGRRLTHEQERKIRDMWRDGSSTALIARTVKVGEKTVRDRIKMWGGLPNGRRTTATFAPPREKEQE